MLQTNKQTKRQKTDGLKHTTLAVLFYADISKMVTSIPELF